MCSQQSRLTKKSNAKKTLANIEMARVKSVRRTRSRRMKFCVQRGLGGIPQQARGAIWIATGIACYNMFDPKNGVALVMLFSGSNLSYNEEVIGLTGHCLS